MIYNKFEFNQNLSLKAKGLMMSEANNKIIKLWYIVYSIHSCSVVFVIVGFHGVFYVTSLFLLFLKIKLNRS